MQTQSQFYTLPEPFECRAGGIIPKVTLAYETYGELNADKSNAILVFHALSGSQHAAGICEDVPEAHPYWTEECVPGWWNLFIGPKKAINTDKFFVICANYLGGCYGTTGPCSPHPEDGKPYGSRFPFIKTEDIVRSQAMLLDHIGIDKLHAVTGPSVGGLLCLSFATLYPDRVDIVLPLGTGPQITHLQRLQNFEQITAIESDQNFNHGDYYDGPYPENGLMLARMIAHKTYVSLETMAARARGELIQPKDRYSFYQLGHQMESYMFHHGKKFVQRFDANTYLRIMAMWQRFNLKRGVNAQTLTEVFERCTHQRYMIFSIDTDVCFYPEEQAELERILKAAKVRSLRVTVHSEKGHDSFLLEPDLFTPHIRHTLEYDW
ncbi:MAG: homoserine O-acetyltransferase [Verrucomicrobia bacterium]|nr:homoserine O-acetyltransferase [Verrucomicrobiota bacterium]MCH8510576.1 homoserine O-acetyltransferase [Kiritimatiellia bacterium]